jgi:hypothetical protein
MHLKLDIFRVVMNASALPDPQAVSYDLLLSYAAFPFCTPPTERELNPFFVQEHPVLSKLVR